MADGLLNKASIILTPTGYKAGTLYNVAPIDEPYEDFDFARTSTATRINSSGLVSNVANGVPRISYDSNGENGHILLEPTSTNLVTYSEDFSQSSWTNSNISEELSTVLSPDGTSYSYKLTNDAVTGNHFLRDTITVTSGQTYTLSVFIKKGTRDIVSIADGFNVNVLANFDLTNGTVTNVSATSSSIVSFNNGWFRCMATTTPSSNSLGLMIFSGTTYAGRDESGFFYVWGAQVENLSYATSYIPTLTGSTVTRATETATGAGSADLINSTEGVLYAEIAALSTTDASGNISISDGTGDNRIYIYYLVDNAISVIHNINSSGAVINNFTLSDITSYTKIATRWGNSKFSVWINGTEVLDVAAFNFTSNTLNLLNLSKPSGSGQFEGKCKALAVFNEALSDDELTQLTT